MTGDFSPEQFGHLDKVKALIDPVAQDLGYEIVRVRVVGGTRQTLQIMAERADGGMGVGDCAKLSREISAIMDVEDPVSGEYVLEVSSPGIDRPLTRLKDFERFKGHEAKVELVADDDGQRRFKGVLLGTDGEMVKLQTEEGDMAFPFVSIYRAKLVLTDELIAAAQNGKD